MIASTIDVLGPWSWVVLGLILVGLEIAVPGAFLVWLGVAALLTGLFDALLGLSWQASLLTFGALSVLSVLAGRFVTSRKDEELDEARYLNRRAASLMHGSFFLSSPIENGEGHIRVGDSTWRVVGPDMPNGSVVRVVRVEGTTLHVEPA